MDRSKIFNMVDAERKIMGFSIFEISCSAFLVFIGFVFDVLLFSVFALFGSVFMIRYIKYLLKKSGFLRKLFFIFSDLWVLKGSAINYYRKYYL